MSVALVPCPLCGRAPDRFKVGPNVLREVIACPRGCKPHWNSVVIHIRSDQVAGNGWKDLGDAWNTIEVYHDEQGTRRVRFDPRPQGAPEEWGVFLPWSPATADERMNRHAAQRATGSAS